MDLDTFCSREKLFKFVDKAIIKKQKLNRLFFSRVFRKNSFKKTNKWKLKVVD